MQVRSKESGLTQRKGEEVRTSIHNFAHNSMYCCPNTNILNGRHSEFKEEVSYVKTVIVLITVYAQLLSAGDSDPVSTGSFTAVLTDIGVKDTSPIR